MNPQKNKPENPRPHYFKIKEVVIDSIEAFEKDIVQDKEIDYFRGEDNAAWQLSASMIRKIKDKNSQAVVLNYETMMKLIQPYRDKYDQMLNAAHSLPRFLFYLQHAISYTPFIDITKNLWVAVSFALAADQNSNRSINHDAAIYGFKINGSQKNNQYILSTQKEVTQVLNKLSIGINKINTEKKAVTSYIVNVNDLAALNDRMQYQKGAFLLLNNYSISNDYKSVQKYNHQHIDIVKYIISNNIRFDLKQKLQQEYPLMTLDYLNNPYQFLENINEN